jgi:hypothetical protein
MAFKTVEVGAWKDVVIEGETVSIQCLTNGQIVKLSDQFDEGEKTLESKLAIIAPYVQIKGVDLDKMADYLARIASVTAQVGIIEAVFKQNQLSGPEAKNSGSLSATSTVPARESNTTTTVEMAESASALLTEMKSLEESANLN